MSSDHKAPILTAEAITDGIDISTWTVRQSNTTLQYSVWDFAGQTVYYNTHQVNDMRDVNFVHKAPIENLFPQEDANNFDFYFSLDRLSIAALIW